MSVSSRRGLKAAGPLHVVVPSYDHMKQGGIKKDIAFSFTSDEDDYLAEVAENLSSIGYEPKFLKISMKDYREALSAIPASDRVLYLCDGNEVSDGVCGVTPLEFLEKRALRLCANGSAFMRNTTYKERMKELFVRAGVPTPPHLHVTGTPVALRPDFRYPLIVKPANLYGAVGLDDESVLLCEEEALERIPRRLAKYGSLLVEEFIVGREFTVFLLDGGVVHGLLERAFDRERLSPLQRFMSYDRIWVEEGDKWEFRAVEDRALAERLADIAVRAYRAVDGSQYTRVDIRYEEDSGRLFVLEVNAPPSLSGWDSGMESVRLSGNGTARDVLARILSDAWRNHDKEK